MRTPHDNDLLGNVVFNDQLFSPVSLGTLESERAYEHNLDQKYMDLQIERVLTKSVANVYYRKKKNQKEQVAFTRLFMCRVVSSPGMPDESDRLVYVLEATNSNKNLWKMNTNHRDNGAIAVGSVIRLTCLHAVENYMRGDIPLVKTDMPAILLNTPRTLPRTRIDYGIESNMSAGFVYNQIKLWVLFTSFMKTQCAGLFCDRQRILDWNNIMGCGCYGMLSNASSLAIQHVLSCVIGCENMLIRNFSSLRFSSFYMTEPFPGSVRLSDLQLSAQYVNFLRAIRKCIKLVNANGGYTIVGWYKRGMINDKTLIAAHNDGDTGAKSVDGVNVSTDSGDISVHFTCILPTNRDFMDRTTLLGAELHAMKFNPNCLVTIDVDAPENNAATANSGVVAAAPGASTASGNPIVLNGSAGVAASVTSPGVNTRATTVNTRRSPVTTRVTPNRPAAAAAAPTTPVRTNRSV